MGDFKVFLVVLLATFLPPYVHLLDIDDPCATVRCLGGYDCVANYEGCESEDIHNCTAKPECVIRSATDVEFADDTGTFKACNLMCIIGNRCIIKDGKAQCVPDSTTETPPTTPASSWKDPCNSIVCNDGEQCYAIYHTCETGICFPTPVCVPTSVFEETEVDVSDTPPVTPAASSWEDPCNLIDCRDGEQCHTVYHTCETGTCPPTPVCVPTFEEAEDNVSDTPPVTPPASSWEDPCNLKECKDGEECYLQAHTCDTGTCPPTAECMPILEEVAEDETGRQQCTQFGDDGKLCEADCLESEECRCINPPDIFCFVGPCLSPTCVDKNTFGNTLDNTITETTITDEN